MKHGLLIEELKKYSEHMVVPMHMPGHKRNITVSKNFTYLKELCAKFDITEIDGFDDLHDAQGILKQSMAFAARLWESQTTHFLVNGSTCGILAGIYAATKPGDTVLVARNCHKSVYHAVQICALHPLYILPEQEDFIQGYGSVSPKKIKEMLEYNPKIKLIILTSPTYEGIVSDIESICKTAHERNIPVLIDEAHGSHLGFGHGFPNRASQSGADIVINSLHKTLPSLTQTALLHRNGELIEEQQIQNAIDIFETSSPSYLLMSSIDSCIMLLEEEGALLFKNWNKNLNFFYKRMKNLNNLEIFMPDTKTKSIYAHDRSKIVISAKKVGMTGRRLMQILREQYCVEVEMASPDYIIAMTGMGDTKENLEKFANALLEIDEKWNDFLKTKKMEQDKFSYLKNADVSQKCFFNQHQLPQVIYPICNTIYMAGKFIKLEESIGKISKEYIWAYPPGVPIITPGEQISTEIIFTLKKYIYSGMDLKSTTGKLPFEICVVDLL